MILDALILTHRNKQQGIEMTETAVHKIVVFKSPNEDGITLSKHGTCDEDYIYFVDTNPHNGRYMFDGPYEAELFFRRAQEHMENVIEAATK